MITHYSMHDTGIIDNPSKSTLLRSTSCSVKWELDEEDEEEEEDEEDEEDDEPE